MKKLLISSCLLLCIYSQCIFGQSFTGKTKEEAVNKWRIYQNYIIYTNQKEYIVEYQSKLAEYIKQINMRNQTFNIITPLGIITR